MQPRHFYKLLGSVLVSSLAVTGCGDDAPSGPADASAGDLGPPGDVTVDAGSAEDLGPPGDVSPDRFCGMCGCDFTGRLVGSTMMLQQYCAGARDGGVSDGGTDDGGTGPDPATCEIDCSAACGGVTVSGMGIFRPWALPGFGGGVQGVCERADSHTVRCVSYVPCGRLTEGQNDRDSDDSLPSHLARAAWLEAQSVGAFARMALELEALDAPARLVRLARLSARDEARHAEAMAALATRCGAPALPDAESPTRLRDLESIALENAREGCTRETWGALLAQYQSLHGALPGFGAAMADIARDEARHAQLSWALDAWARSVLPADARARLDAARDDAWSALEDALSQEPPAALRAPLGLPSAPVALTLARNLRSALQTHGLAA